MAPHQWRLSFRVERAKEQLARSGASLADIAIDCGFADQSHFTRIFTKHAGCCPGAMAAAECFGQPPNARGRQEPQDLPAVIAPTEMGQFHPIDIAKVTI